MAQPVEVVCLDAPDHCTSQTHGLSVIGLRAVDSSCNVGLLITDIQIFQIRLNYVSVYLYDDRGLVVVRAPDIVHGEVVGVGLVHGRVIYHGPVLGRLHVTNLQMVLTKDNHQQHIVN